MDTNLVSLVTRFLTPDILARLATSLGLDRSALGKLIAGALPTILASLGAVAATPGGARRISEVVANQDPGALDTLVGALGGQNQQSMLAKGSQMLGSLVGGDSLSAIASVLGGQSGVEAKSASSLLGFLGPAVMSVIGKQDPKNWMDAGGVANLFAAQKDAVAAAMPAGLASALGAAGLSGVLGQGMAGSLRDAAGAARGAAQGLAQGVAQGVSSSAASARHAASDAADAVRRGADHATQAASRTVSNASAQASSAAARATSGSSSWIWIIAIALLAAVAWYMMSGGNAEKAVDAATQSSGAAANKATQAAGAAANQVAGLTSDAVKQATASIGGLTTALGSITDAAGATAALPKLKEAAASVDKLSDLVAGLPVDARKTVAAPIAAALPTLRQLIEKVLALPGVGDVVRPVVEPIVAKLDALAKA